MLKKCGAPKFPAAGACLALEQASERQLLMLCACRLQPLLQLFLPTAALSTSTFAAPSLAHRVWHVLRHTFICFSF